MSRSATPDDGEHGQLNVRIPLPLRRSLRARCALKGITMSEGVSQAIEAWCAQDAKDDSGEDR